MKVHYLEIVSHDVEAVCEAYEIANSVNFSGPDELLGGARTHTLPDDTRKKTAHPYGELIAEGQSSGGTFDAGRRRRTEEADRVDPKW